VTLATLPVTLTAFQSVSLVSPLAHIVAVPLLPVALASTAVLAAVSSVEPLASAIAWLAWLPSTLLVEIVRVLGSLPGAALSTGRLPALAAFGLAAGLLTWGLWGLPEARELRARLAGLGLSRRLYAMPALGVSTSLVAIGMLQLVRPDGRVHVHALSVGRGDAVLIRGPTGRTALVVGGHVDSGMLASQVANHLAVWEHKLDSVLPLIRPRTLGWGSRSRATRLTVRSMLLPRTIALTLAARRVGRLRQRCGRPDWAAGHGQLRPGVAADPRPVAAAATRAGRARLGRR